MYAVIGSILTFQSERNPGRIILLLVPLFWVVVVVVAIVLIRRGMRARWAAYGGPAAGPHRSPEATLSQRFANGEIEEEEYRARLQVLRANRPPKR